MKESSSLHFQKYVENASRARNMGLISMFDALAAALKRASGHLLLPSPSIPQPESLLHFPPQDLALPFRVISEVFLQSVLSFMLRFI